MSWLRWGVWGFASTVLMTVMMALCQRLRLTRMNLPLLLGTMLTADRDRAKLYGVGMQLVLGWVFAGVYVLAFEAWGRASWWLGGLMGLVHAAFLLGVMLPLMPALHPRMASESQSPTEVRQLEPPGWMGLHYGVRTPVVALLSHVAFGVLFGVLYRL